MNQVWLKSIKKNERVIGQTSDCIKRENHFRSSLSVCDENERRKKRHTRKNDIHGRKPFITLILRNCESNLHEPQGNDYEYNEGTIC